jgi:hypothetical protein
MYSHEHAVDNTPFPEGKTPEGRTVSERTLKAVAKVLAKHANEKGLAWPSIDTIVRESGCARATVHRAISVLRSFGVCTVSSGGPKRGSNRYLLQRPSGPEGKETFGRLVPPGDQPHEDTSLIVGLVSPGDQGGLLRILGVVSPGDGTSLTRIQEVLQGKTHHENPTSEADQSGSPDGDEDGWASETGPTPTPPSWCR